MAFMAIVPQWNAAEDKLDQHILAVVEKFRAPLREDGDVDHERLFQMKKAPCSCTSTNKEIHLWFYEPLKYQLGGPTRLSTPLRDMQEPEFHDLALHLRRHEIQAFLAENKKKDPDPMCRTCRGDGVREKRELRDPKKRVVYYNFSEDLMYVLDNPLTKRLVGADDYVGRVRSCITALPTLIKMMRKGHIGFDLPFLIHTGEHILFEGNPPIDQFWSGDQRKQTVCQSLEAMDQTDIVAVLEGDLI